MCCFSRPVEHVSQTKIFARSAGKDRQYVVYSMTIDAKEDLAMILPIPVPEKSPDDAVKFINLEKYPEFFADLKKGFPEPPPAGLAHSLSRSVPIAAAKKLDVVTVGSFEASFVPTIADLRGSMTGFACQARPGTNCRNTRHSASRSSSSR